MYPSHCCCQTSKARRNVSYMMEVLIIRISADLSWPEFPLVKDEHMVVYKQHLHLSYVKRIKTFLWIVLYINFVIFFNFSDTCILQVLCVVLQLVETPKKYILSDVFTSWVLTLFNSEKHSPRWLFSVPSLTLCQCRPLVSRLTFTLLGEACLLYPSGSLLCNI